MKRRLSEREAWSLLAKVWGKPSIVEGSFWKLVFVVLEDCTASGLCRSINCIVGKITEATAKGMKDRVLSLVEDKNRYVWPLTLEGAKSRAAFCRSQVRRLSRRTARR